MAKRKKINTLRQVRSGFKKGKNYIQSFLGLYKKYSKNNNTFANFICLRFTNVEHRKRAFNISKLIGWVIGLFLFPFFVLIAILDIESR